MYCEKCGKENKTGTKFCTNCGNSLDVSSNYVVKEEKSTFGWGILSFFVPIAGLILFIIWKKDRPKTSKTAGICAIIGVIFSIFIGIFVVIKSAIPQIIDTIDNSKKSAWESNIKMIESGIELQNATSTEDNKFDVERVCTSSNNMNITSEIVQISDVSEEDNEITCAGKGAILVTPKGGFLGEKPITITCTNGSCSNNWYSVYSE